MSLFWAKLKNSGSYTRAITVVATRMHFSFLSLLFHLLAILQYKMRRNEISHCPSPGQQISTVVLIPADLRLKFQI